jgi:vacuolar protein sorting-associated protein VTA1
MNEEEDIDQPPQNPDPSGMGWNMPAPNQNFPEPTSSYQPPTITNIDAFNLPDPPKDPEPKNPGGFVPYQQPADYSNPEPSMTSPSSSVSPEVITKAQKYSKYASSALNFSDVPTAIDYLEKCLNLLKTGHE